MSKLQIITLGRGQRHLWTEYGESSREQVYLVRLSPHSQTSLVTRELKMRKWPDGTGDSLDIS